MGMGAGELPPHSEFRSRTSRSNKNFQASRERTLPCVRLGKREVGADLPSHLGSTRRGSQGWEKDTLV